MKKPPMPEWREVHRYPIGFSVSEHRGLATFQELWSVDEVLESPAGLQGRTRTVRGLMLRSTEHPDAHSLMLVVATATKDLVGTVRRLEDYKLDSNFGRITEPVRVGRTESFMSLDVHYCDERLLPEECIRCVGAAHPVVLFDTWAGRVKVECELLKRTPKRFKVRFIGPGLGGRIQRGEIRYVPHAAVRDGRGEEITEPAPAESP